MLGTTYLLYVTISLGLTFWVGRTLNKNGHVFLMENYHGKEALALAINNMLLVGFYMVNIGFICYTLKITEGVPMNIAQLIEFLSVKVGLIAIVLGFMHFGLMFALQHYSELPKRPPNPLVQKREARSVNPATGRP
jgi:hypothetical protein